MSEFQPTIKNVLTRETFQNAKVIAGSNGLERQVKWTHILETNKFDSLINGGELILTTGAGLQLDSQTEQTHIKKLIERNAVGICIEIGTHVNKISSEIIQLANNHDFPIIIFEKVVKFVDITQDLHSLIVNQHHLELNQLNLLSKRLNELSLSPNGILKILQELHANFQQSTLFITVDTKSYYYPPEVKDMDEVIRSYFMDFREQNMQQSFFSLNGESFALFPVKGLGQIWGYLCLQVKDCLLNEFFYTVMDCAALAIAQIMLRNRTIEERKQNLEDELVRNLLHGKHYNLNELQTVIPSLPTNLYYRVVLIQTNYPEIKLIEKDWEEIKLQRSMMFKSLFKQHGLFPAVSIGKNEIAIISFYAMEEDLVKDRSKLSQVITTIMEIKETNILDGSQCTFGVSKVYQDIALIAKGYEEARDVFHLQESKKVQTFFYENIGVYRLLLLLQENGQLESYIQDYLGTLLNYDQEMKSDLFTTLEIYLDCSGSKKEAAERLFIVRQTLYHRLVKIEQLIGQDFMEPMNRLALETAIKAYYLVKDTPATVTVTNH
ncbi:PucR family transcriptional regulator [Virgibacillus phasianinus]|uniref:PucR family transcriptional regulator n=1 Tax=Virgibacillus phasianinus TaxID=2017483 RepID=A0A220U9E4_9BACI|nr:PucR family transcriptional regulator [Virgibacillus phasianinus]